jgi:hypothetical protein
MVRMKLYADHSVRFVRQLVADVLFVCWVIAWCWVGDTVHDGTMALAEPGHRIEASATSLSESMTEAGDVLEGVPVVGDSAATPFDKAADASDSMAEAGRQEVAAVEKLALWLGLAIALIPILVVAAVHLPVRYRFVREATAGQRFIDSAADDELFAFRAMANQPMHLLARISDDPVGAVRRGDRETIRALAALEMRSVGLVPRPVPQPVHRP